MNQKLVEVIYLFLGFLSLIGFLIYFTVFLVALFFPKIDLTTVGVESWSGPLGFWPFFLIASTIFYFLYKGTSKDSIIAYNITKIFGFLGLLLTIVFALSLLVDLESHRSHFFDPTAFNLLGLDPAKFGLIFHAITTLFIGTTSVSFLFYNIKKSEEK